MRKGPGYLEGKDYIVTWALGHLVTLADPEAYDVKYKNWNLADLPMLPENLKLTVIKQSAKAVQRRTGRNWCAMTFPTSSSQPMPAAKANWSPAGSSKRRKSPKPVKRLWISSVTDKAIKDGFLNLKPQGLRKLVPVGCGPFGSGLAHRPECDSAH